MAKIDDLGLMKFPPEGLFIDRNKVNRIAYLKGVNDTLIALTEHIKKKSPESLPEFVDDILKFIESYYE